MGLTLTNEQQHAVDVALRTAITAGHMSLIGPAGCGKTTTIRAISARVMQKMAPKVVLLLAPTHKARRQFAAGDLARGTVTMTIHKFCNVKAEQWRDQDRFKVSARNDLSTIEQITERIALVIVDEASMVPSELAARTADLCKQAGVGIIFAGDPYQLPPVRQSLSDDEDGPDAEVTEDDQAREFLHAPVVVRLDKVLRHGGPILDHATAMRENWDALHGFPMFAMQGSESQIEVVPDTRSAFINHFAAVHERYEIGACDASELFRDAPRALCYTNRVVNDLTTDMRVAVYGDAARDGWRKGEIILFPSYTTTLGDQAIYSSTDAIVTDSQLIDIHLVADPVHWKTPGRGYDRTIDLEFSGKFQELTVQIVMPNGIVDSSREYIVRTPIIGDPEPRRQYADMRKALVNARSSLGNDDAAWKWLKGIKDLYLTPVTSAFVLTVHKSQGSTFDHVYVSRDLLRAKDKATRNPLLYVAVTRAAKSITFGAVNVASA